MTPAIDVLTRNWKAHRWRVIAGGVVVALALLTALVHTPLVRAGILSWALPRLEAAGLRADVDRLDYNLFTLTVGLQDVAVFATGSETPFFSTDAIRLDLPWSVVGGTLGIQSLEIDRPRIAIERGENGSLNLPEIAAAEDAGADAGPASPLRIDRLVVRGLDARYADAAVPLSVDGRAVTLDLDRGSGDLLAGRLSMSGGVTLRLGDRETTMTTLEGGVAFDGSALSVDTLTLEAPEARVRLDGTVSLLAGEQRMDVRYEGRLDAERLAPWAGLDPAPRGRIAFSGSAQGPLTAPDVRLDVRSDGLAWSTLGDVSLEARAAMSGPVVTLESFRASLTGGEISGEARLQLDDEGSSQVRARFDDLNLGLLARVASDLPVRIASIAGGDVALEWIGQDVTTAQGTVATRLRAPSTRTGALALAGRLDLELARGTWKFLIDQRIADTIVLRGSAGGRLVKDDLAASTLEGRAALEVGSLSDALQRLRAAGLEIGEQISERLRGTVLATVALGGTFDAPHARSMLDARELWLDATGPVTAHADFDATRSDVAIDPLRIDIGSDTVTGSVAIGLGANTLRGTVSAALPQLAPLAQSLPEEWRPDGSASLQAQLGGALDNPTIGLTFSSRDLRVAGQTFRTVRSTIQVADRTVTVDELELTQDGGRLTAAGRYDIPSGRYAFDATGDGLAVTPLILSRVAEGTGGAGPNTIPLDARFDLRFGGEGTLASPGARGFVEFAHLDWDRYRLGAVRADVVLENGGARLDAHVPSVDGTLQASVELDTRAFTFMAAVETDLQELVRSSGLAGTMAPGERPALDLADIDGALAVRVQGNGRLDDLAGATVDLDFRLLDVAINGAPLRLERPARLRYTGAEIVADDFELRFGGSTLSASGALRTTPGPGEALVVSLTGSLGDFVPFVRLVPAAEDFDASGAIDLRMRASGSLEAPTLAGQLSVTAGSLASGALPPVTGVALQATYAEGVLDVSDLRGGWQGATVTASGRMPAIALGDMLPEGYRRSLPEQDRRVRATARIESVTPDVLAPFVDQQTVDQIAGRFDAMVEIEAGTLNLDDVRADVTLSRAEMEFARVPLGQTRPTRLRLADGHLYVVEWTWAGAGGRDRRGRRRGAGGRGASPGSRAHRDARPTHARGLRPRRRHCGPREPRHQGGRARRRSGHRRRSPDRGRGQHHPGAPLRDHRSRRARDPHPRAGPVARCDSKRQRRHAAGAGRDRVPGLRDRRGHAHDFGARAGVRDSRGPADRGERRPRALAVAGGADAHGADGDSAGLVPRTDQPRRTAPDRGRGGGRCPRGDRDRARPDRPDSARHRGGL